jgi:putative CocE/NonD family hydrolase
MSRGWLLDRILGLRPASTRDVAVHADIAVPMRDGVVSRADRYVPAGREDAPVVVVRSPYGRKGLWGRLYWLPLARRGYQVVIQSCRGTADSEGEFVPFAERDDSHDTVSWLRQQPWYPGRFATFGPSYAGLAQWAVVDAAGDELVAMTAVLTSSALVRSMFFGGAPAQQAWLSWSAVIAPHRRCPQGRPRAARCAVRSRRPGRGWPHPAMVAGVVGAP